MTDEQYKTITEHKSVSTIVSEYRDKQIDLTAKYQRDIVWKEEQKSSFINSVFKNIVPNNIILNLDTNHHKFICVDGKQRITSLCEYKKNKFAFEWNGEFIYYDKMPGEYHKNKNYRTMTNQEKSKFDNRSVPIVKYEDLSYEDQVDIFNRIQKGMKLTSGEIIMSVFNTDKCCDAFKQFCDDKKNLVIKYVSANKDRKGHVILLADLMYILETNNNNIPSKKQRDDFLKEYGTYTKIKGILESFGNKMDIYFSKELFNAPEFTKSLINKMNQAIFLSLFICCKEYCEDITKLNDNKLNKLKENILSTIKKCIELNVKGSRSSETIEKVQKIFNKKDLVIDSDTEIDSDNDNSDESSDVSSEEEIVIPIKKKIMKKK